jgi:hypothetical protein
MDEFTMLPIRSDRKVQQMKRITGRVRAKQLHRELPRLEEFDVSELIVVRRWIRGHAVFGRDSERRRPDRPECVLPTAEFEAVTESLPDRSQQGPALSSLPQNVEFRDNC